MCRLDVLVTNLAICYAVGQLVAVVADILLFYLLYYLATLFNVSLNKWITYSTRALLVLSVFVEVAYKIAACLFYIGALYGKPTSPQLFSVLKGGWGFLFTLFAGMQFSSIIMNLWGQRNGTLFWTLVLRSAKSVLVILSFAVVLVTRFNDSLYADSRHWAISPTSHRL
jgi:hypothetical protein